jgi:hypothetical protein
MTMVCHECGSTDFRVAHIRKSDIFQLLKLQHPVRCRVCKVRTFGPLRWALKLPQRVRKHVAAKIG